MTDIDPLWLRSFVAVAESGAITRAAERVHRTQSAVSTHLQQLEASVGVRLGRGACLVLQGRIARCGNWRWRRWPAPAASTSCG